MKTSTSASEVLKLLSEAERMRSRARAILEEAAAAHAALPPWHETVRSRAVAAKKVVPIVAEIDDSPFAPAWPKR